MPISGRATHDGTRAFFEGAAHKTQTRELGATGLITSPVGFGAYRVDDRCAAHSQALDEALESGLLNLIDTASNYTQGESECAVGRVLRARIASESLRREQVIVVTKAGYVSGPLYRSVEREGMTDRLLPLSHGEGHSIDPDVVLLSIAMSQERLGLSTIDYVLLHNPEYHLEDVAEEERGNRDAHFYEQLRQVFKALENCVREGRIAGYGVSSNTVGAPETQSNATSFERLVQAAEQAGGPNHHFKVLQAPVNLLEQAVVTSTSNHLSIAEQAERRGIAVLANRPLNAITKQGLVRLARAPHKTSPMAFAARRSALKGLERNLLRGRDMRELGSHAKLVLNLSKVIPHEMKRASSWASFDEMVRFHLWPTVERELEALAESAPNPSQFGVWRERYRKGLGAFFEAATAQLDLRDSHVLDAVFEQHGRGLRAGPSLTWAQQAIAWASKQPGITSVLTGMRHPDYVASVKELTQHDA